MFKKLFAVAAMLFAVASFAAVEVNKATAEELDAVKGIGTKMAQKIVDERAKGQFKSWDDFVARVKGTGGKNAAKLSDAGLTVGGKPRAGTDMNADSAKPMAAAPAAATAPMPAARPDMRTAPMTQQPRAADAARK